MSDGVKFLIFLGGASALAWVAGDVAQPMHATHGYLALGAVLLGYLSGFISGFGAGRYA